MKERKGGGEKIQCAICRTEANAKSSRVMLQTHVDAKHPKLSVAECYPTFKD